VPETPACTRDRHQLASHIDSSAGRTQAFIVRPVLPAPPWIEDSIKRPRSRASASPEHERVVRQDGIVDTAFYDKMSNQWREEQSRCQRKINRLQEADKSYLDEGVQILELAGNAQRLFESQESRQKRRRLNFLLSNCSWEDGEVVATFRQPFDLLAEANAIAADRKASATAISAKTEIWLPDLGSNQGPADQQFDFRGTYSTPRPALTRQGPPNDALFVTHADTIAMNVCYNVVHEGGC
jgi:hypothetical protein